MVRPTGRRARTSQPALVCWVRGERLAAAAGERELVTCGYLWRDTMALTATQQQAHPLALALDWLECVAGGVASTNTTWGGHVKVTHLVSVAAAALTEQLRPRPKDGPGQP